MKNLKFIGLLLTLGICQNIHAQTVFNYGNNHVDKSEFMKSYNNSYQSNHTISTASLENHANLYALYKIKVAEALNQGYAEKPEIQSELINYKKQLANSYLIDQGVKKDLIQEAYKRSLEEVNVSHILIRITSSDTQSAFKTISDINQKIQKGESFEKLATKYSEDKATAVHGGQVGYISAFDVVYPFEQEAYNTPVGKVSKIFKTKYGYHILKVLDRRPSSGKLQVAQILLVPIDKDDPNEMVAISKKADSIYDALKSGVDFYKVVAQESQDRYSVNNNGILPEFGRGTMTEDFEKAAFALQKPGDISKPIKTEFGYHIIKLIKKTIAPPFSEVEADITKKVEGSDRMEIASDLQKKKTLKQLHFKPYPENVDMLIKQAFIVDEKNAITLKGDAGDYKKTIFSLDNKQYTQAQFIEYILHITGGKLYGQPELLVNNLYKMYLDNVLQGVQLEQLEANNAEYKKTINEYRDGIVLFALTEETIWNRANNDTTGLRQYYEANKNKYTFDDGFYGYLFMSNKKDAIEALSSKLKSGLSPEDAVNEVNSNTNLKGKVRMENSVYEYKDILENNEPSKSSKPSAIYDLQEDKYIMYYANTLFKKGRIQTLDEARTQVISDYQKHLEKTWEASLIKKYPITINHEVIKDIASK